MIKPPLTRAELPTTIRPHCLSLPHVTLNSIGGVKPKAGPTTQV